jgi:hypothetical protein
MILRSVTFCSNKSMASMIRPFLLCTALLTCACVGSLDQDVFDARRVDYQHEAGSVHVAVLSVADWDDYVNVVQPRFSLTEEQALQAVIPTTQAIENTIQSVVRTQLGATTERGSSVVSDPPSGVSNLVIGGPGAAPPGVPNVGDPHHVPNVIDTEVGIDPMLHYGAATALFQEVHLLNNAVRDAVSRDGFEPFVVRAQISLMPSARNRPYDAYAHLSFFLDTSDGSEEGNATAPRIASRGKSTAGTTPQVVPLLVTDSLEGSSQSRVMDQIQQAGVALRYLRPETGVGASRESVNRELESAFGTDLNSLMTVARLSDNTLRVRLGAMAQASARYAMVPRSHVITLLLLIPEGESRRVEVVCRTQFVDAESGLALRERPIADVDSTLVKIASDYQLDCDLGTAKSLAGFVQTNDAAGFDSLLATLGDESIRAYRRSLWADFATLLAGSQYAATSFDVPRRWLPAPQAVLVEESPGEQIGPWSEIATARFAWSPSTPVRSLDIELGRLRATMIVTHAGREAAIAAHAVQFDSMTSELVAHFPSLTRWGWAAEEVEIVVRLEQDGGSRDYPGVYRVRTASPTAE